MKYVKSLAFIILLLIILCSNILQAQVGIGTDTPDASAALDIESATKGVLMPRVALTSTTDQTTIANPATGLLVYNTGADSGFSYEGYVYWNGTEWRSFNSKSLAVGTISGLECINAALSPDSYTSGTPYTGILKVDYTGGNGGYYEEQTFGPVNGLTLTLPAGNYNVGAGTLNFNVTGTPTVSSPSTTTISITMGGQTCDVIFGEGLSVQQGELVYYRGAFLASEDSGIMSDYLSDLPVLGGKIRLDAEIRDDSNGGNGQVSINPRLYNISSAPIKVWFSAITTVDVRNAGNYLMAPGGYVNLDNGIYYNTGFDDIEGVDTPRASGSGTGANQEVVTVDLSLEGKWYKIYYFPIVDNKNTVSEADNERLIHISIQRLY